MVSVFYVVRDVRKREREREIDRQRERERGRVKEKKMLADPIEKQLKKN